jgi:hypothetical protein
MAKHVSSQSNPASQGLSQSQPSHRKRSKQGCDEDMDVDDSHPTSGESENFCAEE